MYFFLIWCVLLLLLFNVFFSGGQWAILRPLSETHLGLYLFFLYVSFQHLFLRCPQVLALTSLMGVVKLTLDFRSCLPSKSCFCLCVDFRWWGETVCRQPRQPQGESFTESCKHPGPADPSWTSWSIKDQLIHHEPAVSPVLMDSWWIIWSIRVQICHSGADDDGPDPSGTSDLLTSDVTSCLCHSLLINLNQIN